MSTTPTQQLAKIRQAILNQEALRDVVPAEQLDAILVSLREQEQALLTQLGGEPARTYGENAVHVENSTIHGNVVGGSGNSMNTINTSGGDYVGGNKVGGDQFNAKEIHFHGAKGPDPDPAVNLPPIPVGLHSEMLNYLSKSDINTICFYLDVDYNRLAGETLDDKVAALITDCRRKNRVADLLQACAQRNPSRRWG